MTSLQTVKTDRTAEAVIKTREIFFRFMLFLNLSGKVLPGWALGVDSGCSQRRAGEQPGYLLRQRGRLGRRRHPVATEGGRRCSAGSLMEVTFLHCFWLDVKVIRYS